MLSIFRKKSPAAVDYSVLGTDMHSHLLPGIDDGAGNVEQSIELINGLQELGFKKFITTPHIMSDMYPNTQDTINNAFDILKQSAGEDIPLRPAAEYFLDETFDDLLQQGQPLLCITNNTVLVELSFVTTSINFKERIFDMQIRGYQPVLAHPERYLYFGNSKGMYDELKDAGCQFACNILSFTGYYGKGPVELANYLLKKDYVDYLGTDAHHLRHIEALRKAQAIIPIMQRLSDLGRLLNSRL
ncbi:MAG TPA: CpsB/CapC family capsule biosynthesis tyrosine phosphatase [Chitinophagaceae bacterium]|nr:CpsB/CapC family capsule biosynthesis tyrosine phosphatase [Chitinophagaceae bacterium]